MAIGAASDYLSQLQALLPPGAAWTREPDAVLTQLLAALAEEFARVDARVDDLLNEADPRGTLELLADWERVCGLPTSCMSGIDQPVAQRRNAVVAQLTAIGGQSRVYYIGVAAELGYVITITEFRPWTVDMPIDLPIYGEDWAYAWQVNAASETVLFWPVNGAVNEPLAAWGNELLECVLTRLKPAHTIILFAYGA
jgi:uncharacterized protein YmfQ (DUF2313 family)